MRKFSLKYVTKLTRAACIFLTQPESIVPSRRIPCLSNLSGEQGQDLRGQVRALQETAHGCLLLSPHPHPTTGITASSVKG